MQQMLTCFCDECGALVAAQATLCLVCGRPPFAAKPLAAAQHPNTTPVLLPPPMTSASLAPGVLFAQRYRILDKVGEGGFGSIYKAQDIDQYRRLVAIKQITLSTLRPREMIEATDSYNREVKHLSRLRHEHLPRIYDSFTDQGHWYIVMEYIEGVTLESRLARGKRLSVQQIISIGIMLCNVLGYLHAQRPPIIFRDVKPANVIYSKSGRIYLIDFGIARHYVPGRIRDTGPLGSPGYAAPEQYGKAQTSAQTDIYGLGATLQTLFTGKDPLELAVGGKKLERRSKRRIPKPLRALLEQMLAYDVQQRPQSMEEVRQYLERYREQRQHLRLKRFIGVLLHSLFDAILLTLFMAAMMLWQPFMMLLVGTLICLLLLLLRIVKMRREESP